MPGADNVVAYEPICTRPALDATSWVARVTSERRIDDGMFPFPLDARRAPRVELTLVGMARHPKRAWAQGLRVDEDSHVLEVTLMVVSVIKLRGEGMSER